MRKLLKLAIAFSLPLAAMATPTATAVWRSNLGQSYTIGGVTYAIDKGDGTLNADGTITAPGVSAGAPYWAPSIDLSNVSNKKVSILVKYSGLALPETYTYPIGLAAVKDSSNYEIGTCVEPSTTDLSAWYYDSAPHKQAFGSTRAVLQGSGYMLFSYSSGDGSRTYMGSSVAELTGGQQTKGHWSSNPVVKLSIGGDARGEYTDASNMIIEEVALFIGEYLSNEDVADYVFPTLNVDTTAAMTMTELNTAVAAFGENTFNYFSASPVVTLDVEPSDATKTYIQSTLWNGTVFIKDVDKTDIYLTNYGNKNSTLKFSGVNGYIASAQFTNNVTPVIELEDSTTEGREYGLHLSNGYSFKDGYNNYKFTNTPELKGSGTLKTSGGGDGVLVVVDKWDNFTGKLDLSGKTIWFGTGVPALNNDSWVNLVNKPGTVRLGSTIPSNYSTWTVPNGYHGTVVQTTAADATETAFLTASAWKGTCKMAWNPGNNPLDIVNYGNANSVIEITNNFGVYPTQNGGSDGAEVAAEVKIADGVTWTVSNGWTAESYRTTFAKLSGAGNLTVNGGSGGVGDPIPYTITRLEGFTGTIAGTRGKFTIGTIVAATEPTPGTKLVNCTTANAPVLDNTEVYYNNAKVDDIELEFKAGDGIYVAYPVYVAYTVTVVRDYDDPTDPMSPYTETFTTNYYESINAAIATSPAPDKIYLIDSSIEAPTGWQKSLEDETYVLTPIPPVAYVDGMGSSNGYIDLSEALAAALASGTHSLYIVSSQTLETLTVPDGCTLTLSVPAAMGGALDVSNIVVVSGASLQMASAVEAEYTVSGTLDLSTGDFSDSSVDLAAVGATCTVRSGATAPTVTTSVANYEVSDDNGTYGVREYLGWIYSVPGYWNYTGTWSEGATLGDDKVTVETNATYTASKDSDGDIVTLAMTVNFDEANNDDVDISDVKGAVRIGKDDNESYVFQFATWDGTEAVWTNADVTAAVDVAINTNYTFLLVFDLTTKTYTTSVIDGTTTNALTVAGSTAIAFAKQGEVSPIRRIDFVGSGTVSSLTGSYESASAPDFVKDEEVTLDGGSKKTLTEGEAAWLNACGDDKATVAAAIAGLSLDAFTNAYLLNLDVTAGTFSYTFNVSGIDVGDDSVEVEITLTRTGALVENDTFKPINGTLTLYGTAALDTEFEPVAAAALAFDENKTFADGATTTTVTVNTTETGAKFYKAEIK